MESKSIVIHKGGKEEKYKLCVEDYVLSYLKYETGSLECSEIYFYGMRKNEERKYIIYGAGRDKKIPVFDTYDLLEEIMCRLTQAGPVFMVREAEEIYQIKGFDIFYQDNQAMQSYMVERQHNFNRPQEAKKWDRHGAAQMQSASGEDKAEAPTFHAHGMMSAQLGMILIILVAIVINSSNSYDKMKQLNRSAGEVFFAIENQEADESVSDGYEPEEEIVVERKREESEDREEGASREENANQGEKSDQADVGREEETNREEDADQERDASREEDASQEENVKENPDKSIESVRGTEEEPSKEEQTEALSRNVTRYYQVEKGDTLYTICQKIYGDISQVEKICELNDITDPDRIRSGQKIILP